MPIQSPSSPPASLGERVAARLAVLFRIDRTPAPHTFEHLLSGSRRPAGGLRVGYACYSLEPCDLSDAELRAHVLLLGRPGDNASQLVASLALQQVARGGGCIVVGTPPATYMDRGPHGLHALRGGMRQLAERLGRGADLRELECDPLAGTLLDGAPAGPLRAYFAAALQERRWLHVTVPAAADPLAHRLIPDLRGAAANYCGTASGAARARTPGLVFVPLELCPALVQHGSLLAQARAANLGFVFYAPSPTLTERALEGAAMVLANAGTRIVLGGHPAARAQQLVRLLNFAPEGSPDAQAVAQAVAALRAEEAYVGRCRGEPRCVRLPALPI